MYDHVIEADSLPWMPLEFRGVFMRVLHQDTRTGAMTVLTRLEPGAVIPSHRHSEANETVFVLSGDFIEAGTTHGAGSFFVGKAGPTGRTRAEAGVWCSRLFLPGSTSSSNDRDHQSLKRRNSSLSCKPRMRFSRFAGTAFLSEM